MVGSTFEVNERNYGSDSIQRQEERQRTLTESTMRKDKSKKPVLKRKKEIPMHLRSSSSQVLKKQVESGR